MDGEAVELEKKLTWRQACEILGCGKSSLYRLVSSGQLPSYGVGERNRWYKREDCENLLQDRLLLDKNSLIS